MSSNSNNNIFHNSIEHFLCNPSDLFSDDVFSCLWIVFTNSVFQVSPQKIVRQVEILGIDLGQGLSVWREMSLSHGKLCLRYSNVLFEKWGTTSFQTTTSNRRLKYLRHSFLWDRLNSRQTDNPWSPIPKISTRLTIFWGDTWKTEFTKTIHRQERTSSETKSDGLPKKCSKELWTILLVEFLLYYHKAAQIMEQT